MNRTFRPPRRDKRHAGFGRHCREAVLAPRRAIEESLTSTPPGATR